MKKFIAILLIGSLMTVMLIACGGSSGGDSTNSGGSDVHMNDMNFVQSSITIKKGDSLNLIDDAAVPHIIENGSWVNGTAQPKMESGAPKVDAQFQGNDSKPVGPFNTVGTYHLYCTIHTNMNLTVTVQ